MELPGGGGVWLAPSPSPSGPAVPDRHDEHGVGTFIWPPVDTSSWPPVGTFSWPRTISTIHRVSQRNSLITPRERRRAVPAWRRFERYAPNDLWQIDGTQVELADDSKAWIIDILDDHARFAIGSTAARRFTATAAWRAMETAIGEHGAPRQLISANGTQFISRDGHQPVHFQQRLAAMGIRQLSSRPAHPQTCGKLERYHRTFKDFYADNGPAATIEELQALCDQFRWHYNHQRPHQGIDDQLPVEVYQALPKVGPGDSRPRRRKTGPRVLV